MKRESAAENPLVSVIMPSYQHGKYISDAIESVLSQTFSDYELLISDDASTDGSQAILRSYESRIPGRIIYQPERLGAVKQVAFLRSLARGKYIALLNSDDFWAPDKLEKQTAFMESHPEIALCFTQAYMTDADGQIITKEQFPLAELMLQNDRSREEWLRYFWSNGNCLCHPSVLARREIYEGEYRFNGAFRQLPDFEVWTRIFPRENVCLLQEPLAFHRRTGKNTSNSGEDNDIRLRNELSYILYRMIIDMEDELFYRSFCHLFRRKDSHTTMELLCERYFLLNQNPMCQDELSRLAVQFYYEHASEDGFLSCMKEKYGYAEEDFFRDSAVGENHRPEKRTLKDLGRSLAHKLRKNGERT